MHQILSASMAQTYKYADIRHTCVSLLPLTSCSYLTSELRLYLYIKRSGFDSESLKRMLRLLESHIRATDKITVSEQCITQQGIPNLPITCIKHAVLLSNTYSACRNRLRRSWRSTKCWQLWSYECIRSTGMLGYTSKLFLSISNDEPMLITIRDVHMSSQKT